MRSISQTFSVASLPEELPSLRRLQRVRWPLLLTALVLAGIGCATISSASAEMGVDYLPRQLVWIGLGMVLFLFFFALDYKVLTSLAVGAYVVSLALLVLVLFIGKEAGGARSWLGFGGFGGQPSELAKLATAILLARFLAAAEGRLLELRQILGALALVGMPMALIALEPDLGGAAMFVPMLAGMLLVAGVPLRAVVVAAAIGVVGGGALWTWGMQPYQRQRVLTFMNPASDPLGAGYHVGQSKIAVGSGQLVGRGYRQGTQSQLRFLPERHTDFIFAVLAEEWGFAGVVTVLALYALYILDGVRIAARSRDRSGLLLAVGLLSIFSFHALYNTAMVVGLVPITGIPLPFLSYGGSFTLMNFAATGILLGIDFRRYVNR
jgi:rod shape determining protein RodA